MIAHPLDSEGDSNWLDIDWELARRMQPKGFWLGEELQVSAIVGYTYHVQHGQWSLL